MVRNKYHCSQTELYEACKLLSNSLEEHLDRFADYKAKYTQGVVDGFRADRVGAREIPDVAIRKARRQVIRLEMVGLLNGECRQLFKCLRGYIVGAYGHVGVRAVRMKEAGFGRFKEAMNYDWEVVNYLFEQAIYFVESREAELMADGNMPIGFLDGLRVLAGDMDGRIQAFLKLKEGAKLGTAVKIRANNDLFDLAMEICRDGQIVFAREEAIGCQFMWERLLEIISPPGAAGLKVYVRDGESFLEAVGLEVSIRKEGEPRRVLVTDGDGFVHFTNVGVGRYRCSVVGDGFVASGFDVVIGVGVTSTRHCDVMRVRDT